MAHNQSTVQTMICQISRRIRTLSFLALCLLFITILPVAQANTETLTYGPTKYGDTLWKIAEKNLPDQSMSIEQFVYSIYLNNLNAFQSGNINQLLKGVTLKLPRSDRVTKVTTLKAKQFINLIQTDAKKLTRAKKNKRRFNQQIKKYSRQLRKYRRNSRAWKNIYRKLARSKRNLAVTNRKIIGINKIMHGRANSRLAAFLAEPSQENKQTDTVPSKVVNNNESKNNQQIKKNQESTLKQLAPDMNKENHKSAAIPAVGKLVANNEIKEAQISTSPSISPSASASISPPSGTQKTNWFTYLNENFILIAGIINGIILLFVLFKLFEKEEELDFIHE